MFGRGETYFFGDGLKHVLKSLVLNELRAGEMGAGELRPVLRLVAGWQAVVPEVSRQIELL